MSLVTLVDCNSFFVSCEKVFRPELRNRPVVVLSNNDGCIVARSRDVKKLGIPMGAPYFKYKELLQKLGVVVFSSNFALYADLSSRVMETIATATDSLEIYSCDEAFLKLETEDEAKALRTKILKWTGIPTSIGLSTTKTLAKVANHIAKDGECGVKLLADDDEIKHHLKALPVEEIWGIGRKIATRLHALGIRTALEFREMDDTKLRSHLGVTLLRTALELRGITALSFDEEAEDKKGIVSSRSFGRPVTDWKEMEEAIALHTSRAAEKMRRQESQATFLQVYLMTNRFNPIEASYSRVGAASFVVPTDFTPTLVAQAKRVAKPLFYKDIPYKKCGVFLGNFVPRNQAQEDLFVDTSRRDKEEKLMDLVDQMGGKLFFLSQGIEQPWKVKREFISPAYGTDLFTIQL